MSFVLSIDQGTTSTRAIVFDDSFCSRGSAQMEFAQHFPRSGWVEHDAMEIWRSVSETIPAALVQAGIGMRDLAAIGITNQRETVVIWDRATGLPIHNAIVWQDRRTAATCERLRREGMESLVTERTGLVLDPYFSATKIAWILDRVEGARARAERGDLAFGTIDSWLIFRLTGGRRHVTDATNAARTSLCAIDGMDWDDDMLRLFDVPRSVVPEILDNIADFGVTDPAHFGAAVPIRGAAGDQQAAVVGQACFSPGMLKATYGTGCFALLNTGGHRVASRHRLISTLAYRLDGRSTFALEGSIFNAGAAVQWLRDGVGIIDEAGQAERLAAAADPGQDIFLVPAFTGLGAPWWRPEARGAIFGLTRATGPAEFARAALESVGFQTFDLLEAMRADWIGAPVTTLRVDGGMAASDWTMQCVADLLGLRIECPAYLETTALGAAWLAGCGAGVWPGTEQFATAWRAERHFEPAMDPALRDRRLAAWRRSVERTMLGE